MYLQICMYVTSAWMFVPAGITVMTNWTPYFHTAQWNETIKYFKPGFNWDFEVIKFYLKFFFVFKIMTLVLFIYSHGPILAQFCPTVAVVFVG